jgi:RHS repeat-associated protein
LGKFSQITSAGYVYDALGRNTSLPAVDSPNGTLTTFDFAADNRITKQVQGTKSWEYTFDVLGRRVTETAKTGSTINSVTTRHYGNESDNPTWVTFSTQTDVYTPSLGSSLNVIKTVAGSTTTKSLQIANLHGDTITSVVLPATGGVTPPSEVNLFDEYGLPTFTANPNPQDAFQLNYGSLGQAQRQTTDTGITLMGVRGYNPVTGQFLSPDPIPGGNETPYNYPNDPINSIDLDGKLGLVASLALGAVVDIAVKAAIALLCAGSLFAIVACTMLISGAVGAITAAVVEAAEGGDVQSVLEEAYYGAVFGALPSGLGNSTKVFSKFAKKSGLMKKKLKKKYRNKKATERLNRIGVGLALTYETIKATGEFLNNPSWKSFSKSYIF